MGTSADAMGSSAMNMEWRHIVFVGIALLLTFAAIFFIMQ